MKNRGGTSPASRVEPARRRFRVIPGGRANLPEEHAIRLTAVPLDDGPASRSDAPDVFLRSTLGRTAAISAALHVAIGALFLLMGSPPTSEAVPISVTLVWTPASPVDAAAPSPPVAASPAAPVEEIPATPPPAPPELAAIEPAAEAPAAPAHLAAPLPPPQRHLHAAAKAPRAAASAERAPPSPAQPPSAQPTQSVEAGAQPPQQSASLPLIPPRAVSGAAGNGKPVYPAEAKRRGIQGKVVLRVEVSREGMPTKVLVLTSSGHRDLDDAAVTSVQKWHFVPASRGGEAVDATAEIPIQFRLAD